MADYTQDANCVGAWLFKEGSGTTVDNAQGTSANDGAFASSGNPAWASMSGTNAPSYSNYMTTFDGNTGDYIDLGTYSVQTLTMIAWVNPTSRSTVRTIFGSVAATQSPPQFRIETTGVLGLVKQNSNYIGSSTGSVNTGTWTNVAVTYNSSGDYIFYISGSSSGNGTDLKTFTHNDRKAIGRNATNNEHFYGSLTEVAVFSRVLSSTEINDIMDNGLDGSGAATVIPLRMLMGCGV